MEDAVVAMVTQVPVESPAERLAARLDDPATAEALNQLLDHADLLAVLVTGLSEFVSRGDTITDTIGSFVTELKGATSPLGANVDVAALKDLAQRGSAMLPKLTEKLPVIEKALEPGPSGLDIIDVGAMLARSASEGTSRAAAGDVKITGVLTLLKALKDPDVSRAAGFVLSVAKVLGEQLQVVDGRRPGAHRRPAPSPHA